MWTIVTAALLIGLGSIALIAIYFYDGMRTKDQ